MLFRPSPLVLSLVVGLVLAGVSSVHAQVENQSVTEALDLKLLSESSIATHLRLTDEQRVKLAELLERHVAAMASEEVFRNDRREALES